MKLEYLKEFLALSQTGNYTAAADNVYISESTLSRHMMALEKELRTILFIRSAKGVMLTEAGTLLVPYARSIVSMLSEYDSALESSRLTRRRLTIGFGRALQQYGLAEFIFRFRRENPEIDVLLTEDKSENLWRSVINGECDFAFCYEYDFLDRSGLQITPLLKDTMAVVFPEKHPLADCKCISLSQLKDEHFIMQSRTSTMYKYCSRLMREAGCDPKKVTFAGNMLLDMVSQGVGIALSEKIRYQRSSPPDVRFVDLDPPAEKYLVMVCRRRTQSPQAEAFCNFIRQNMTGV